MNRINRNSPQCRPLLLTQCTSSPDVPGEAGSVSRPQAGLRRGLSHQGGGVQAPVAGECPKGDGFHVL